MSREEAIEILSDMRAEYNLFGDEEEATRYHVLSWAIQEMKATQTERKKGRWIRMYYSRPKQYTRICSECREISWFCGIGDYNYCPWCGARMEGKKDETD